MWKTNFFGQTFIQESQNMNFYRSSVSINKKQDIIEMKNNNTNIQYKVVPIKGS